MIKTAIVNVPRLEPHRPPTGPAIICQVCENLGHQVSAFDLNIEFFHACKSHNIDYHGFDGVWNQTTAPSVDQLEFITDFIAHQCAEIHALNFDYLLVSVFGTANYFFIEKFLQECRKLFKGKILAGGMGVGVTTLEDAHRCYGTILKDQDLVDDFIVGEGEMAVEAYFNGTAFPGINNTDINQLDDLDSLPWPNYSYYNLDLYDYLKPGKREVYITGSRGCVRKCTYCDVERYWPKYRYRSGKSVANEIIHNYNEHGVTRFYFTDSLVNGSLKVFTDFCETLANYNFDQPISWSGQFIFRTIKTLPRDHFELMRQAGADILYVGLETGSDRLRAEMGKKFSNEDIDYQLAELSRNKIHIMPLMFTGYLTETLQDHYDNLAIFPRWQRYVADGTIIGIELGASLEILPGAPVERMIESHGIEFLLNHNNEPGFHLWWSRENPELTITERIRRKLEVHEAAIKYLWPVWRQSSRLQELKDLIVMNNLHHTQRQQFYKLVPHDASNVKQIQIGTLV
jgi:hypothetical protein